MKKLVVEIPELEETLINLTVNAIRERLRGLTSGSELRLNYPATHLWGGEAALDWLDWKWPEIQAHLLECAQNGKSRISTSVPEMGKAAKSAILTRLQEILPRSKIADWRGQVTIDWTDVAFPART